MGADLPSLNRRDCLEFSSSGVLNCTSMSLLAWDRQRAEPIAVPLLVRRRCMLTNSCIAEGWLL